MRKGSRGKRRPLRKRWEEKVVRSGFDGCWYWGAHQGHKGYGRIAVPGEAPQLAHRVSYELHHGAVPAGVRVLHSCDVPACVNPRHLFLGTDKDNSEDMCRKGRASRKLDAEQVHSLRAAIARAVIRALLVLCFLASGCAPKVTPVVPQRCTVKEIDHWVQDDGLSRDQVRHLVEHCRDIDLLAEMWEAHVRATPDHECEIRWTWIGAQIYIEQGRYKPHLTPVGEKAKSETDCEVLGRCQ